LTSFIGLDLQPERASTAALERDLSVVARSTAAVAGGYEETGSGVRCVPAAEWIRAGGFALQELYGELPLKSRKLWGVGLSGPDGWIALDSEFEPLCDVRLPPAGGLLDDLDGWLERNTRLRARISLVLSPKDLFRFMMSGAMAADTTSVCAAGLLAAGKRDWDRKRLEEADLPTRWFPPVFQSSAATSRLHQEGMRQSGLPGSPWLVAGSTSRLASMVASADLRSQKLWLPADEGPPVYAIGAARDISDPVIPPGYRLSESPIDGHLLLLRKLPCPPGSGSGEIQAELASGGYEVSGVETLRADAELGAAALAAIGSGIMKSWDRYYALLAEPPTAAAAGQEEDGAGE